MTSTVLSIAPSAVPKLSAGNDKILLPNMRFISRLGICMRSFSSDFNSQTVSIAGAVTMHTKPSNPYTFSVSSCSGVCVTRSKPPSSDVMATKRGERLIEAREACEIKVQVQADLKLTAVRGGARSVAVARIVVGVAVVPCSVCCLIVFSCV